MVSTCFGLGMNSQAQNRHKKQLFLEKYVESAGS
jgi:hypothetical protein